MSDTIPTNGYVKVSKEYVKRKATAKIEAILNTRKKYELELELELTKKPEKYFFGLLKRNTVNRDKVMTLEINVECYAGTQLMSCRNLLNLANYESADEYVWISDSGFRYLQ